MSVTLQGFDALEQALAQFSNASARNILQRAAVAALEPIAEDARQRVPKDTGQLHDSIIVTTKQKNEVGKAAYANVMQSGGTHGAALAAMRNARRNSGRSNVEVYFGTSPAAPHAHLIEFGSVNNTPQPFIRPAWEAGKAQVLDDLKASIAAEIAKAVVRAQRRAVNAAARAARAASAPAAPPTRTVP